MIFYLALVEQSAVSRKVGGSSPTRSENSRTSKLDFAAKICALNYQFQNPTLRILEFEKLGLKDYQNERNDYRDIMAQSASAFGCNPKGWWIKTTQEREQQNLRIDFSAKDKSTFFLRI